MNGGEQPERRGCSGHGAWSPPLQRPDEQVCGKRSDEHVERVHPPEAPVDRERRRRSRDRRRDQPGCLPAESPAEVEAQRYRRHRAHDREPAKRLGARVQGEHAVREHEVERSAAPVQHHRLEHLVERPHGDQAGNRLVLVQRLV